MKMQRATLYYGTKQIKVLKNEMLPLPDFDFSDPFGTAEKTAAIMSNAAGGFRMEHLQLVFSGNGDRVVLYGDGMAVIWEDSPQIDLPKMSLDEALAIIKRQVVLNLPFGVLSTQYGDSWKTATVYPWAK